MLPTSAGVDPATSWSPVGRRIQLSHRGRQHSRYEMRLKIEAYILLQIFIKQLIKLAERVFFQIIWYNINPKYSDIEAWSNSINWDPTPDKATSD